jgi:ribosomal-protein-alanine N-acetyltransferase
MATAAPTKTHIRWMIRRDMVDVLRTERDSFEFSWTEDDFLKCLRQRNCIGMVAEADDRVVGFMIYELHKNKLNVLNFAVAPPYRRQGIGTQMIGKLVAKLTTHRRSKVTLAVRESNLSAQLFFRQQEFKAVKVLKNFYEDSGEDAFLMEYRVGSEDDDDLDRVVNRIARYEQN